MIFCWPNERRVIMLFNVHSSCLTTVEETTAAHVPAAVFADVVTNDSGTAIMGEDCTLSTVHNVPDYVRMPLRIADLYSSEERRV